MEEKRRGPGEDRTSDDEQIKLGNQILDLLGEHTKNPGEAFVILQQLSIFVWDQYKVDWTDRGGFPVADTRKQRLLDFISGLIDSKAAADSPPENAS